MAGEWHEAVTQIAVLDMWHLLYDAGSGPVRHRLFLLLLWSLAWAVAVPLRCSWVANAREPYCGRDAVEEKCIVSKSDKGQVFDKKSL